jgi:hypothetical protein
MLLRCPEPGVQAATEERFEIEDIWRRHLIQQKARKVAQCRIIMYLHVFTSVYSFALLSLCRFAHLRCVLCDWFLIRNKQFLAR